MTEASIGDPEAGARRFSRLYSGAQAGLLRFALHLTRDPVRADDLLHQAAMRGMAHIDTLTHDGAFRTWMSRILHRTFLNEARRAQEDRWSDNVVDLPSPARGPEAMVVSAQVAARIIGALGGLPPMQAEAVWLVDAQGFQYREVAEIMDVPRGTAATLVARGRQALRGRLKTLAIEQGVGQ